MRPTRTTETESVQSQPHYAILNREFAERLQALRADLIKWGIGTVIVSVLVVNGMLLGGTVYLLSVLTAARISLQRVHRRIPAQCLSGFASGLHSRRCPCETSPGAGICRRQPQDRARCDRREVAARDRQAGDALLCGKLTLAKQLENGAPADLFISADRDWMDYLQQRQLIDPKTRIDLLGNSLVLIAPADGAAQVTIAPGFPLAAMLGDRRLAMADPDKCAGRALRQGGADRARRLAQCRRPDRRVRKRPRALLLVARGEAPLGIVYRTDATAEPMVKIGAPFRQTAIGDRLSNGTDDGRRRRGSRPRRLPARTRPHHALFDAQGFTMPAPAK